MMSDLTVPKGFLGLTCTLILILLYFESDDQRLPPTSSDNSGKSINSNELPESLDLSDDLEEDQILTSKREALLSSLKKTAPIGRCRLNIVRNDLLISSYDEVMSKSPLQFRKTLFVKYLREDGYDNGGLTKDWLDLIIKELLDDNTGLFKREDNYADTWPVEYEKVKDRLNYYKFLGRIMAHVILEKISVNVYLPMIIYKQILNLELTDEDLKKADPEFYEGLIKLREIEDIEEVFALYGEKITKDTLEEYIKTKLKEKFVDSTKNQVEQIKTGFNEIIEPSLLEDWSPEELKLLICGGENISVDDWRLHTTYRGFSEDDMVIIWFWNILGRFTEKEKSSLLRFVTGLSRVPAGGFQNIKSSNIHFRIETGMRGTVPMAHTCINTIEIYPYYELEEKLEEHLRLCIASCQGKFDLA